MTTATSQQAADATVRAMNAGLAGERLPKSPLTFTPAQVETLNTVYDAARNRAAGSRYRVAKAKQ
ncbi:hypothetical protein [Xenophilus sp. Marseille-Q4582]|uniref:hypothetical protein n=1 Tax=Xenophilus sp. Marseille-Q4582 TaxID=2866600 RepID=UPI001CE4262C|nr:hypothetical protein [Xenophilus sp. Marseille-Q4582]